MPKIIVANWKMYLSREESLRLFSSLAKFDMDTKAVKLVVAPSVLWLEGISKLVYATPLALCGQDVSSRQIGAFTGGISCKQLAEIGCTYCIVGHSERRAFMHEVGTEISDKIRALLGFNITPIVCIGEDVISKKSGQALEVISMQLEELGSDIEWGKVIVAYEPVWAIGSGMTPSKEEITNVVTFIKEKVQPMAVLYGGSVSGQNILDIKHGVDGFLIGFASTKFEELKFIINNGE